MSVYFVDLSTNKFIEDREGHVLARLLLPRPTDDPKDPLVGSHFAYPMVYSVTNISFTSDMESLAEILGPVRGQLLYISVLLCYQLYQSDPG